MDKVCKIKPNSPLCNDFDQLKYIYQVGKAHKLDPEIMLGIAYAESRLGTDFKPKAECSQMNNRIGMKGFKQEDGSTLTVTLPYQSCWLYPFTKREQWDALSRTLKQGYTDRGVNSLKSLSRRYVGKPGEVKSSRVIKVSYFLDFK